LAGLLKGATLEANMERRARIARVSRTLPWALAASAALLLGIAAPASAGTLDQQQTLSSSDAGLFSSQSVAQTFTPGSTGRIDQVDLLLFKVGTPPGPSVTVEIRGTTAASPDATPLATATIPISAVGASPAFLPFTFATPVPITPGTKFTIVAYSPGAGGNAVGWRLQNSDVYSEGAQFYDSTEAIPPGSAWTQNSLVDMAFKTYLVPPLPPAPPTGGPGPVSAAPKKKCKKKKHRSAEVAKKKCKKKHH
jgi:hypothetical protein